MDKYIKVSDLIKAAYWDYDLEKWTISSKKFDDLTDNAISPMCFEFVKRGPECGSITINEEKQDESN